MSKPIDKLKERLKRALDLRDMKPIELSIKANIPKSSVSQYLSGFAKPKADRVYAMAKVLNVSEAWLLGYDVSMEKVPNVQANPAPRKIHLDNKVTRLVPIPKRKVAIYGSVPAGIPLDATEYIEGYIDIPDEWQGDYMALRVYGDSMCPKYEEDDIILIRITADISNINGKDVIAYVGDMDSYEATLKKAFVENDGIMLQPLNTNYQARKYSFSEIRIVGYVVQLIRNV